MADLTGLDVQEVLERRNGGESFADIAKSKGVDPDEVESRALDEFKESLDERMTSTEPLPRRGMHDRKGILGMCGAGPEAALAELADIELAEIRERRANGESLAQIAKAEGVDIAKVIDAVIADAEKSLDGRVESGVITEAQKTEALERLRDHLAEMEFLRAVRSPGSGFAALTSGGYTRTCALSLHARVRATAERWQSG